jgi:hypothetical protein
VILSVIGELLLQVLATIFLEKFTTAPYLLDISFRPTKKEQIGQSVSA